MRSALFCLVSVNFLHLIRIDSIDNWETIGQNKCCRFESGALGLFYTSFEYLIDYRKKEPQRQTQQKPSKSNQTMLCFFTSILLLFLSVAFVLDITESVSKRIICGLYSFNNEPRERSKVTKNSQNQLQKLFIELFKMNRCFR